MKKYTITLDEKQMEYLRMAMKSQEEVANDVTEFAYRDYTEHVSDATWGEFETYSAEYYMARGINRILESIEGQDNAEHNDGTESDDRKKAIPGSVISSKEFANEIDDYIDDELMGSLMIIARHLYAEEYMNGMPTESDLEESVYGIRDGLVSFMQDWYGLVKSDGKNF